MQLNKTAWYALGAIMVTALLASVVMYAPVAPTNWSLVVDGVERQAIVEAPNVNDSKPHPVVFVFHGHGGSMRFTARRYKLGNLWPEAIAVYPQGLPTKGKTDPEGKKNGWQQSQGEYEDRDLKYFDALLAQVKKTYKVDDKRIYTCGHSNGGRFTYLLWAERPSIFAAYGPSASPMVLKNANHPAPMFITAGEKDQIVPFKTQQLSMERIKQVDGADGEGEKLGEYATLFKGKNGNDVVTFIHPGGHTMGEEALAMMIDFFKAHPKK
ncbi:MAG: dienelactone hydrolase family protein [Armatimonadetes bacterium]|nr:dienelactone hydrolase family protein [Armatimonadota bacterium]